MLLVLCAVLAAGCEQQTDTRSEATTAGAAGRQTAADDANGAGRERPAPDQADSGVQHGERTASTDDRRRRVARPAIVRSHIPFGTQRKRDMAAYARRHYGLDEHRLIDPRVIVQHFTVTDSVQATIDIFSPNVADPELRELPGVCAHFVIARDGAIHQLVPLGLMCRHTVGLNYTALGIEHVGRSDGEILGNARQLAASLRLTAWLRCRFAIEVKDVIGHNESLSSPHHEENVVRLRSQTHEDFKRAGMQTYRSKLRTRGQRCA